MDYEASWRHFLEVTRPALTCAPLDYMADIRANLVYDGIPAAVRRRDTAAIFDWLIGVSQFQGISDASAISFAANHGVVGFNDIASALRSSPGCPRLRSYWNFAECGYRKAERTCGNMQCLSRCSLPTHPTRKGSLIVAAYSLFLFVRDVCGGDLVCWIDQRLAEADPSVGAPNRAKDMGAALLEPLRNISGIGDKVWSMALADLLLAADPSREPWVTTGASMIVVDSLLHNHLHRTGVSRRFNAEHAYGPQCYAPGGCSDLMRGLAERIDARQFNPAFPASFPRFIQFAIWRRCSTSELNICNGVQIDDRARCENAACSAFDVCDRLALHDMGKAISLPRPPSPPANSSGK